MVIMKQPYIGGEGMPLVSVSFLKKDNSNIAFNPHQLANIMTRTSSMSILHPKLTGKM